MFKKIVMGVSIVIAIIVAIIFKNFIAGIFVGGIGAIAYFKWTKSILNFKKSKKQ